ncbi:MAG TPA: hypothetical protein VE129_11155, partial [Thermoanaerobaculia bacterium]|nr:hypothetical protein [Thermoanaerobaculia bacterium]
AVDSYGPPLAAGDGFELVARPLPRPGDPGGVRAIELALAADAVVTSSFARDRSFDPWLADADGSRAERDFYERIESGWGPPTAVFVAAAGSYGLNNPVVRVFTRPQEPRTGAAPDGSSRRR